MKGQISGIRQVSLRNDSDDDRVIRPPSESVLLHFDPLMDPNRESSTPPDNESDYLYTSSNHVPTSSMPLNTSLSHGNCSEELLLETLSPDQKRSVNSETPLLERTDSLTFFGNKESDGESFAGSSDEHIGFPSGSSRSGLSSVSSITLNTIKPQRSIGNSNGIDSSDIIFKGFLNHFASPSIFSGKKRHAVLTSSELYLFVDSETTISKQIIPLCNIKKVGWNATGSSFPEESKFVLNSKRGGIDFVFSHSDAKTATMWVNYIMLIVMQQPNQYSVEEPSAVKKGFVKMEGVNQRRFLALMPPHLAYYNSENDFLSGFPIHRIHVSQLAVKAENNSRLLIPTSQRHYILRFQNDGERDEWERILTQAYKNFYALPDESIQTRVYLSPDNRNCADCDQDGPLWASTAFFITLCEKCAGIHRSFAQYPGRILSLTLDVQRWSDGAIQLLLRIGNANSNKFWECNNANQKISPGASSVERQQYINEKYERKSYAGLFQGDDASLSTMLAEAIRDNDLMKCVALYFSGAKFELCNAYEIARKTGSLDILEFIRSHSGLPMGSSFVSPLAASIDQSELLLVSYANETGFKKRRCTLNRGLLHIVLDSESSGDGNTDIERMFPFSQFLFVSYQPQQGFVKLNLSNEQYKFITFRAICCDVGAQSPDRASLLSQWAMLLCQCFIPHANFSPEVELMAAGKLHVCHTACGDWLDSWCVLERSAKLHVIHSSSWKHKSEVLNARSATELKLSNSKTLRIKSCPDRNNDDVNNVVALILPTTQLYFSCFQINVIEKWYDAFNSLLFKKVEDDSQPCPLEGHILNKGLVPMLVDKCVQYLSDKGILHEGLYRKPGTQSKVLALYTALTQSPRNVNLYSGDWSVDEVACALKKFFRDLPDPVLRSEMLEWWSVAATMEASKEKIQTYTDLVHRLPEVNRATLRCLIIHLADVANHSLENKMDEDNLSLIFGHLLLHPIETDCAPFSNADIAPVFGQVYSKVTRDLIIFYIDIFEVTENERLLHKLIRDRVEILQQPVVKEEPASNSIIMIPVTLQTTLMERSLFESDDRTTHEMIVPVDDNTSAGAVLDYLQKKKRLISLTGLSLFQIIQGGEIERPLQSKELVKPLFLRQITSQNKKQTTWVTSLVVKNNYIAHSWETQQHHLEEIKRRNHWVIQFWGCDDSKYRECYAQFSNYNLRIAKKPNMSEIVFEDVVSDFQLFYGCDKKHGEKSLYHMTLLRHNSLTCGKKHFGNVLGFCMDEERLTFLFTYIELLEDSPVIPRNNNVEMLGSDTNLANRMSRFVRSGNNLLHYFKFGGSGNSLK